MCFQEQVVLRFSAPYVAQFPLLPGVPTNPGNYYLRVTLVH
jgi:hypothetical protein